VGWQTEEFGTSHEGVAGAALADGTEPKPVLLDLGSGSFVPETTEWWAYNGRHGRPLATDLQARCSCGWRGTSRYPIDWAAVNSDPSLEPDASDTHEEWVQHIRDVKARTVPLPPELEELLDRLDAQLSALADEAPVAVLRAVTALDRLTRRVGHDAAHYAQADEVPSDQVATALGLPEADARALLNRYAFRR
jgi:hypothetical protein